MKTPFYVLFAIVYSFYGTNFVCAQAQPEFRPPKTASRDPRFLGVPTEEEPTAEELAIPPAGEIQKIYLRSVNRLSSGLGDYLATVPAGPNGQQSSWFSKFQSFKTGLEQLAASRLQTDAFGLIPKMEEVFAAEGTEAFPEFGTKAHGWVQGFGRTVVHAVSRHITDQGGTVSTANLVTFVKVFSTQGFASEGAWESEPIPVDEAGIMVLDAAAVVTQLKALPWQRADFFLGGNTATEAFARYESGGNGLPALKTKYAANKPAILAKWNELKTWVDEQRAAGP